MDHPVGSGPNGILAEQMGNEPGKHPSEDRQKKDVPPVQKDPGFFKMDLSGRMAPGEPHQQIEGEMFSVCKQIRERNGPESGHNSRDDRIEIDRSRVFDFEPFRNLHIDTIFSFHQSGQLDFVW